MPAQTVGSAVAVKAKQDQLISWIRAQQDEIAMAAASHIKPSAIVRVTQGALRRNDKLALAAVANPQSLLYALLDCARLGHEPDTDDYYLVPFGNEVTGIEGYKGIIERMYRAGGVTSVVAQVVRAKDRYVPRGQNTPPLHDYHPFDSAEQRGTLRGAYAYAVFPGGACSQVITMGRDEVMEHKAKSRGSDKPDSPWQQWEPAMWKKTVLRALEPYVPTSTEYRNVPLPPQVLAMPDGGSPIRTLADADAALAEQRAEQEIVDAELVDEPADPTSTGAADADPTAAPVAAPADPARAQPVKGPDLGLAFRRLGVEEADQPAVLKWLMPRWTATAKQIAELTKTLNGYADAVPDDLDESRSLFWTAFHHGPDAGHD